MKFGFYSCMSGMPWGGSEELWWRSARLLQNQGHEVSVNYKWWVNPAEQLAELTDNGASVWYREKPTENYWYSKFLNFFRKISPTNGSDEAWLEKENPDAVLFSLGYHPDRIRLAPACQRLGIPYTINVQCASHSVFIHESLMEEFRNAYQGAYKVYFVSQENQEKLETNMATRLDNAEIVANPFNVKHDANPDWPEGDIFKLACVGRIHFMSKGQDLIAQVLKREKWRKRPIKVSLYGKNQGNKKQLEELIRLYQLEDKLEFGGFAKNVEDIWKNNHALFLPSRYEGAALVVIETMLCNRMVVTTDTGRNRELIREGETGFIAAAANADLLDEALEKAWQMRHRWREMGIQAGQDIRENYTANPIGDFVAHLMTAAESKSKS
ncbi:MAG: glycosyltransferase family 4 protein [Planctomycetota bacterium]|nr:glycosyltransferase family 4 protein [Planctomycetota bacterium]